MCAIGVFAFDGDRLQKLAKRHREDYARAKPFPHIVIDNFLPEGILENVLDEFPKAEGIKWVEYNDPANKKLQSKDETQLGANTRFLLYQFNSSIFIRFLETLTGISNLIPDPHYWGGGLHQIPRGGFLKIHADFNRHPILPLDRRLNLLLYLNQNWKNEYGGHLELWNREMSNCEARMLPIFNRCVIFSTTDFAFHGHPDPLTCPEGQTRKSIALYYYSNGRPSEELSGAHSTVFKHRPGETYKPPIIGEPSRARVVKQFLRRFIPPIIMDVRNYLRGE